MGISNGDGDGGGDRWRWLRGHFPVPAGCWNRDFLSPESPLRWRWRDRTFSRSMIDSLGFSPRGLHIGNEARLGGGQRGHTLPRRGSTLARAWGGVVALWHLSI